MSAFSEKLMNARKNAGWTQEQLAQQMHVSRQTVSHWENGRAEPDRETLERLHALLPLEEVHSPSAHNAGKVPVWLWLVALSICCLAVVLFVCLAPLTQQQVASVQAPPAEATAEPLLPANFSLEWYQTSAENAPQKAYVQVLPYASPLKQITVAFADGAHWAPNFTLSEQNGIPFTLTKQTISTFDAEGVLINSYVYAGDTLSFYPTTELQSGTSLSWGDLFRADSSVRWYCLAAEGVDANGNQLAFGGAIELLDELEAIPVLSDFTANQQPVPGKAFMTATVDESPVRYQEQCAAANGNPAWEYIIHFANIGDAVFTITNIDFVHFNGEEYYNSSSYSGESIANDRPDGGAVFQPNDVWDLETYLPLMDVTAQCLRITGLDADGEEQSFTSVIELARQPMVP